MPHLPGTTIAGCLKQIQSGELVLPAIQREFVWRPEQITALFDSLMRGYPIGSFLSWKVERETIQQFKFYGFMKEYSEYDNRHNPQLDVVSDRPLTAVLDGQQRLTSLNIGLRGTYAYKNKYGWARHASNFPPRTLHINLRHRDEEAAGGMEYDFRFLTDEQVASLSPEDAPYWFPVPEIGKAQTMPQLWSSIAQRGLGNDMESASVAIDLWNRVHSENTIHFYEEQEQDIERVLGIFIRVNSGGSPLSYSDLLLSIATAQWRERDARKEIHGLVDELNQTGQGFRFRHDLILKSGLVLAGVNDIGFKVKNFTATNMQLLEDRWDEISDALRVATGLLSDFGLSGATISASSVLVPIATYVHQQGLTHSYREAPGEREDRQAIRNWTLRTLLVPGVWGSGLDGLLRALRDVIRQHGSQGFPVAEIETVMAGRGKSLVLTSELIENILDTEYGSGQAFAALGILFPHVNTRNVHHVDHVFPRALLNPKELRRQSMDPDALDAIAQATNQLPNLQLLEGLENIGKSAQSPDLWAAEQYPDELALRHYLDRNALPALPGSAEGFLEFVKQRRALMRERFRQVLNVAEASADTEGEVSVAADGPADQ